MIRNVDYSVNDLLSGTFLEQNYYKFLLEDLEDLEIEELPELKIRLENYEDKINFIELGLRLVKNLDEYSSKLFKLYSDFILKDLQEIGIVSDQVFNLDYSARTFVAFSIISFLSELNDLMLVFLHYFLLKENIRTILTKLLINRVKYNLDSVKSILSRKYDGEELIVLSYFFTVSEKEALKVLKALVNVFDKSETKVSFVEYLLLLYLKDSAPENEVNNFPKSLARFLLTSINNNIVNDIELWKYMLNHLSISDMFAKLIERILSTQELEVS